MVDVADGGPAAPTADYGVRPGMTLRDWFAGKALMGLLSDPSEQPDDDSTDEGITAFYHETAAACYEIADAMLAARERGGEQQP